MLRNSYGQLIVSYEDAFISGVQPNLVQILGVGYKKSKKNLREREREVEVSDENPSQETGWIVANTFISIYIEQINKIQSTP